MGHTKKKDRCLGPSARHALNAACLLACSLASASGWAQGWTGQYHTGTGFGALATTRQDAQINVAGAADLPEGYGPNQISVRWLGWVTPRYTETFDFIGTTDDGMRIWVNEALVVDAWFDQGATEHRGQIALTEGEPALVMVEFYQGYGGFRARLEWESDQQVREVIPSSSVAPATLPTGTARLHLYAAQTTTGERSLQTGRVLVTRFGPLDAALPINLRASGDAVEGQDFAPLGQTASIPAGRSTLALDVLVPDDLTPEPDKTLRLEILAGEGYQLVGPSAADVTIRDDDTRDGAERASVVGELLQRGTLGGHFVVLAHSDEARTQEVARTTRAAPGLYSLDALAPGRYFVSAFLDRNRNAAQDPGEPAMAWPDPLALPPDALNIDFDFTPPCGQEGAPTSCDDADAGQDDAGQDDAGQDDAGQDDAGQDDDAGLPDVPTEDPDVGQGDADVGQDPSDAAPDAGSEEERDQGGAQGDEGCAQGGGPLGGSLTWIFLGLVGLWTRRSARSTRLGPSKEERR